MFGKGFFTKNNQDEADDQWNDEIYDDYDELQETRSIIRDDSSESDFIAGLGIAATIFTTGFLVCKFIYGSGK